MSSFRHRRFRARFSKAVAAGTLIPVFFTSTKTGTGVPELMDALAEYALSPVELPRKATNAAGQEVALTPDPNGPLVAQVFKTRIDPFVARMSFIRLFSGTLKKDMSVHAHGAKAIKVPQLLEMQGHQHVNLDEATAGDIVVVVKVEDLAVGDTITKDAHTFTLPPLKFPTPMIGLAVEPKSRADQQKISARCRRSPKKTRPSCSPAKLRPMSWSSAA